MMALPYVEPVFRPPSEARSLIPHGALCTGVTLVLMRLFVG